MKLKNNEVEDESFEETTLPSKLQTHRAICRPINPARKHPVASEQTQMLCRLMARPGIQRKRAKMDGALLMACSYSWSVNLFASFGCRTRMERNSLYICAFLLAIVQFATLASFWDWFLSRFNRCRIKSTPAIPLPLEMKSVTGIVPAHYPSPTPHVLTK
ncbi:hypothetical protein NPIL_144751 [Nephila pilipes]|uniref:Uncharacterized protein n=1 Tax=Nephila pilipes TaxID=299642 RepID=A0A8X6U4F2_NEPPI|nr:hypothetical protein NPIL_144751 [Nephila pilipes]